MTFKVFNLNATCGVSRTHRKSKGSTTNSRRKKRGIRWRGEGGKEVRQGHHITLPPRTLGNEMRGEMERNYKKKRKVKRRKEEPVKCIRAKSLPYGTG